MNNRRDWQGWNEVISHRGFIDGGENGIPENTLETFEKLLAKHPDVGVEMDVRLTRGGLLLVAHDILLQHFTNGAGFLNEVTRESLANLRIRMGDKITDHRIPELADVFKLFDGRSALQLELKYGPNDPPGLLREVLKLVEKFPNQKVALSSFNHAALAQVPAHMPIGVLSNTMFFPDLRTYALQFSAGGQRPLSQIAFHPDIRNLTSTVLAEAQAAGMRLNAYVVPEDMFEWTYQHGVNPITNYPSAALEFRRQVRA